MVRWDLCRSYSICGRDAETGRLHHKTDDLSTVPVAHRGALTSQHSAPTNPRVQAVYALRGRGGKG